MTKSILIKLEPAHRDGHFMKRGLLGYVWIFNDYALTVLLEPCSRKELWQIIYCMQMVKKGFSIGVINDELALIAFSIAGLAQLWHARNNSWTYSLNFANNGSWFLRLD